MAGTGDGGRRAAGGAAVLALLLSTACGPVMDDPDADPPAAAASPDDGAPPARPEDGPEEEAGVPAPAGDPDGAGAGDEREDRDGAPVPGPCDAATEDAVAATVAAQLDALALGDFAAAYALASPFFRTVVDEERFTTLIRTQYPELLDVASRRLEGCNVLNRRAVLVVGLTATDGARRTLAYELGESEEGWRIDGAYDVAPSEPAPAAPQV